MLWGSSKVLCAVPSTKKKGNTYLQKDNQKQILVYRKLPRINTYFHIIYIEKPTFTKFFFFLCVLYRLWIIFDKYHNQNRIRFKFFVLSLAYVCCYLIFAPRARASFRIRIWWHVLYLYVPRRTHIHANYIHMTEHCFVYMVKARMNFIFCIYLLFFRFHEFVFFFCVCNGI